MAVQIEIEDVRACLEQYPTFGKIVSIAPPQQSEWHGHNKTFRVVCNTGVFYLKVLSTYPQLYTEEALEFQDWAMERFEASGVRTPLTLRNKEGKRLTPCAGYPAVLSAEVAGDEFHEEILAQQESAGRMLGEFHRRAAASVPRGQPILKPLGGYLLRETSLFKRLPDIPERPAILRAADELVRRSEGIASDLENCGYHTLPRSAVIYDFVGVHLRVSNNRVCGVLDFELCSLDSRIIDVCRSMTQLFCIGREAEEDGPARTKAYLRGYNSTGWPPEERELAAFPIAVKAFDFEVITFQITQLIETGQPPPIFDLDDLFGYWMMRVNWWEEHGAEVRESLVRSQKFK